MGLFKNLFGKSKKNQGSDIPVTKQEIQNGQKSFSPSLEEPTPDNNEFAYLLESILNKVVKKAQIKQVPLKKPVVIIAGGASLIDETIIDNYREYLKELMFGFNGTIISGGTTAGIPGLVGDVKAALEKAGPVGYDLLAYLPQKLPGSAVKSKAYDEFHETDANEFSVLEILAYWSDIILSGIRPDEVILLGIDGGKIALLEYRIALSLGAKVCLLTSSGRAVSEILQDSARNNLSNLIRLPDDPQAAKILMCNAF